MREEIKKVLEKALKSLNYDANEVAVDYPKNEAFGDYTTNIAMVLAKIAKKNPMMIAKEIAKAIKNYGGRTSITEVKPPRNFEKIEIMKPGYINFYLSKEYLQKKVEEINKLKNKYGDSKTGKGAKVNNEFVSANPTGPLTIGNGRGGFCGDVISNILKKCGFKVVNEFYVNDAGEQILRLGHSVLKDSEAVYAGNYIDKLNKKFADVKDVKEIGEKSAKVILDEIIKNTIENKMKVSFDNWISERKDIIGKKYDEKAIRILKNKKLAYENGSALWFKTTQFGDDKDRVLIKSNGKNSYFASDCGYILSKIERKFEKIIMILGADHCGYINRFKAAAEALGFKKEIKFIIIQMVRLVKDGKDVRMSKRAGNVIYIDELTDNVGLDVARFFFLMYSPDTHMNFDLKLAMEKSEKNPVYYVQYAHARIASILAKIQNSCLLAGTAKFLSASKRSKIQNCENLSLLNHEKELNLIRELNKFPELVEEIAKTYAVHKLPYYAIKLADKFHSLYGELKILDENNPKLSQARLNLVNAVKIVLAETLRLMGVNAPEKM